MYHLIDELFRGKLIRTVPLQIEIGDPVAENIYSDFILISGRISRFDFYKDGGPFGRSTSRSEWIKKISVSQYHYPSKEEVLVDFNSKIGGFQDLLTGSCKFKILKMLGPTETAESFCASKVPANYYFMGNIYHQFDFSYLCEARPQEAEELHNTISDYIIYVIKNSEHIELFDAVRVADDIFGYQGYLYPPGFIREVWRRNHEGIAKTIRERGKHPILHTDGDLAGEFEFINDVYSGVHPLDLACKNSYRELLKWLRVIQEFMEKSKLVFFTGLPINFLYGESGKFEVLKKFIRKHLLKLGYGRLVASTTHRPYSSIDVNSEYIKNRYKEIKKIFTEFNRFRLGSL